MHILRKIALTFISFILAYSTYKFLTIFFKLQPDQFSNFAIFISAFALTLMTTGVIAFLGFVYPTSKLLPDSYYQIKNPKKLNRLYKVLGVELFRWVLLRTFYKSDNNKKYFNGTKSGIMLFDHNTKQSEFGHLTAFVLIFIISLVLLGEGHHHVFLWIWPLNMLLNIYPIVLQRKHRIVIQRLINRN